MSQEPLSMPKKSVRNTHLTGRSVYIVDGNRTPFLKARTKPGPFSASDLAVACGRDLLLRQPFKPSEIDEVIVGCMIPSSTEANIARVISLRLGCGKLVPAWTVQRNCASGMQSLDSAAQLIASGRHHIVLAGGTDAMSHAPLLYAPEMVNWLGDWQSAKKFGQRAALITKLRPHYFKPIISLIGGLTDFTVSLNMGQTAENIAYQFDISRLQMDEFSVRSHQRLAEAQDNGYLSEITPLYDTAGNFYNNDDGLRRESTVEKLSKLKSIFDKKYGLVTAGNSSQVTDGAAWLILASAEAVKHYQLPVLGKISDVQWAGVDPSVMGLGPVHATTPILQRHNLSLNDIDYWEINEAFAGQVLGCLAAWESTEYCRQYLGLDHALGTLDQSRLNIDGGAIAMGHPVGASGTRIVMHLLQVLKRQQAHYGIATLCIGGGQGGAMLIENISEVQE
jgi:acetyl-CoA C-acetyltransferase